MQGKLPGEAAKGSILSGLLAVPRRRDRGVLRGLVLAAFLLVALAGGAQTGKAPAQQGKSIIVARRGWIKLRLHEGGSSFRVQVPGAARVITATGVAGQSPAAASFDVSRSSGGVSVSLDGKKLAEGTLLAIEPPSPAHGGYFQIGAKRYRGRLLLAARSGGVEAIEQLQIEDWLKGVLPSEIGEESHPEALKAQAVAARSEAVRKLAHPPHASEGYDFCIGEHCQAYGGMNVESAASNAAVEGTYGIVLTVGGEVIDAVYHDVCGGITAPSEDIWDSSPEPGLHAILDLPGAPRTLDLSSESTLAQFLALSAPSLFCESSNAGIPSYAKKYFRWQKQMSADEVGRIAGVGRVKDIAVTERRRSGRVRKLTVVGERSSRTFEKELPIRNAFGLWSGLFVLKVDKDASGVRSVTFCGGGHGHGAGLCQMGARSMALKGQTFDKILAHYYAGARLERIYRP